MKFTIPLGFKIVGVLLRDEVVVQDFLIMRVHLTKEYRAICIRESKPKPIASQEEVKNQGSKKKKKGK